MERKTAIWVGMTIGSTIGAYVPYLWGDTNLFSLASVIMTAVFGSLGIWLGYRIGG